jgi:hypothetical protein
MSTPNLFAWAKEQVRLHPVAADTHEVLPGVSLGELREWVVLGEAKHGGEHAELVAEVAGVRAMFNETRKRMAERLGLEAGTAWNNLEQYAGALHGRLKGCHIRLIETERFLCDAGPLDLPDGCTNDGNVVSLAFRAACTLDRLRRVLAAISDTAIAGQAKLDGHSMEQALIEIRRAATIAVAPTPHPKGQR